MRVQPLGSEDPPKEEMTTHSSILAYNTTILQFLPTESHGQRSLAGYSPQSQGVRQD